MKIDPQVQAALIQAAGAFVTQWMSDDDLMESSETHADFALRLRKTLNAIGCKIPPLSVELGQDPDPHS